MYVSSIVYLKPDMIDQLKSSITIMPKVELHEYNDKEGKAVVVIECSGEDDLKEIKESLLELEFVEDVAHHAFFFEDEVEEAIKNNSINNVDIDELLKDRQ